MTPEQIARNRSQQAQLYGAPLGDVFGRLVATLRLNQSRLSEVLGLSKPMLSQLMSAQRVKIGNPAVLQRMLELEELAGEVDRAGMDSAELDGRLREVAATSGTLSRTSQAGVRLEPNNAVAAVQSLLRATASAEELLSASRQLEAKHPSIAELLRVYGTSRTDEAVAHYRRTEQVLDRPGDAPKDGAPASRR
jgi:transcriptional regulator with XRE-family HTH domain